MPTIMYCWTPDTLEQKGQRPAQLVGGKELLVSSCATPTAPGTPKKGYAQVWRARDAAKYVYDHLSLAVAASGADGDWLYIEDNRQTMDDKGSKSGGTAYWLPAEGDDHTSPARYLDKLGPLPAGADKKQPLPPVPLFFDAQAAKRAEINAGFDAAVTASLTMPSTSAPASAYTVYSAIEVWKAEDPDGFAYVLSVHEKRRDDLLSAVDAATSVETVQAIAVSYAV